MLYIVPTPIGNLEDITLRALRVLGEVDMIYAEDTRTTGKLLKHYNITTPCHSFHIHNEHRIVHSVVKKLQEGLSIALVSDAGTPAVSDPGFLLIRELTRAEQEFTVLPGANAIIPAALLSTFPPNEFLFVGFLPVKKGRQKKLQSLQDRAEMIIFYESPHRIAKLSKELTEHFPGRHVSLVREISKMHEEVWTGPVETWTHHLETHTPKGEMVVVLAPTKYEP